MDRKTLQQIFEIVKIPLFLVAILWVVHLIKITTQFPLHSLGIFPREWNGIQGIFFAPFIHGDFEHLFSNSIPLLVLGSIIVYFYRKVAVPVFVIVYIFTGLLVWLFARRSYHIGASGIVYGLVSFVFWSGVFRRNVRSIVLALIVTVLYSGYFAGILPTKEGISWESHLFGAIVGLIVAFLVKNITEEEDQRADPWANETDEEKRFFLPRDTFEKTKEQRRREQQGSQNFDIG